MSPTSYQTAPPRGGITTLAASPAQAGGMRAVVPVAPLRCSPGGSRPDAAARAPPSPRDRLALTGDTPHPTGRRRVVPRPGADAARVRESRPGTTCTEGAGAALPRRPGRPVRGGPPRLAVRASQGWRPGAGGRPASPRPLPTSSPPSPQVTRRAHPALATRVVSPTVTHPPCTGCPPRRRMNRRHLGADSLHRRRPRTHSPSGRRRAAWAERSRRCAMASRRRETRSSGVPSSKSAYISAFNSSGMPAASIIT